MKVIFLIVWVQFFSNAYAVKLFGVDLVSSNATSLRSAVRKAGAKEIKLTGEFTFYDEFESQNLINNSDKLYLGFSKEDESFVFAEYEFKGVRHLKILEKLTYKYGKPNVIPAKFISDATYEWLHEGVNVQFKVDWMVYKTRLSYQIKEKLPLLIKAKIEVDNAVVRSDINEQKDAF